MSEIKKKLFAYYRVSTDSQKIDMQQDSIKDFIKKNKNMVIVQEFIDKAFSGALGWERPAFKEMVDRLDEVDGIVVYDWDRISREEEFAVSFIYSLKGKNKFVYESNKGNKMDFSQLQSRVQAFFKSIWASEDRLKIKQRQKDGIASFKKKHGYWGRRVYYGKSRNSERLYTKIMFWRLYEQYRLALVSKSAIARLLQMSNNNLYKKLYEDKEKYKQIEEEVKKIKKGKK